MNDGAEGVGAHPPFALRMPECRKSIRCNRLRHVHHALLTPCEQDQFSVRRRKYARFCMHNTCHYNSLQPILTPAMLR